MQPPTRPWKNRAPFQRCALVAYRDDVFVDLARPGHRLHAARSPSPPILEADFPQRLHRRGFQRAGLEPCASCLVAVAAVVVEQRLRHLGCARAVVNANEEDFFFFIMREFFVAGPQQPLVGRTRQQSGTGEGCADQRGREINPQVTEVSFITAGPNERAGFIDAPLTGPANNASSAMTPPHRDRRGDALLSRRWTR